MTNPPLPAPANSQIHFPYETPPADGRLKEIKPDLFWLRMALPFRLDHVNLYLIRDGADGWAVFDTGLDNPTTRALWNALFDGPLRGQKLTRIIVSHNHPDHIGLAGWLCQQQGAPLLISQINYLLSQTIVLRPDAFETPAYQNMYLHHGLDRKTTDLVAGDGHWYLKLVSDLPMTFEKLSGGDTLEIGSRRFEVITADGHAPEQVMLHCAQQRILLSADHVIAHISPNISVYPAEPNGNPLGRYIHSLANLGPKISDDTLVLPGHQMPFFGFAARCQELLTHHETRCDLLRDALRDGPQTVAELVSVLFPRQMDPHQLGFAFSETLAHVNHLIHHGELKQSQSGEGAVYLIHRCL